MSACSPPLKVHFLHIGKTGGTAIMHALRPFANRPACRIALHSHGTTLMQVHPGEKAIFALRDPVERFVSGFNSRRRMGKPHYQSSWTAAEAKAFGFFDTANDLANAISSLSWRTRQRAVQAMRSIQHVRSGYSFWLRDAGYLRSRQADLLWVGRTARLTADFEVLRQVLDLPGDCQLPDDPVLAHRRLETDNVYLDSTGVRNIQEWYRGDYEIMRWFSSQADMPSDLADALAGCS